MKNRKNRNIRFILCLALAAVTVCAACAGVTGAYFTTYTTARGGAAVYALSKIDIPEENVTNLEKDITLHNDGTHECWARVLILCPEGYGIRLVDGTGWSHTAGDDYWYYNSVLPAGATTGHALKVWINVPEGAQEDFNVVVIEECVPVQYAENGDVLPADWNLAATRE